MPYVRFKKYRSKAANYRRRRRYRATRGYRKKTYTKRAIAAERRFDSGIQGGTQSSQAGTIYNLISLARGDDDGDREGNKILLRSLQVVVHAFNNNSTATTTNAASSIRFLLVRIKQNNGATSHTTGNLILNGGSNAYNYLAPLNPKYVGKYYKVLRDWNVSLTPIANTRQAVAADTFDSNKRYTKRLRVSWKKGCEIQFDGNAGSAADVLTNNIAMFAYGSDANISFDFNYRIIYTP